MKGYSRLRTKALIAVPLILAGTLLMQWLRQDLLLLQVGSPKILAPVAEGDVFVRTYMHSMYQMPVREKFRVEGGHFRLVHVQTESEAVLAYLGVEGKQEPNVDYKCDEFTIPTASIGNHTLRVHGRDISLRACQDVDGKIHVKLLRVPLLVHFAHLIWR